MPACALKINWAAILRKVEERIPAVFHCCFFSILSMYNVSCSTLQPIWTSRSPFLCDCVVYYCFRATAGILSSQCEIVGVPNTIHVRLLKSRPTIGASLGELAIFGGST